METPPLPVHQSPVATHMPGATDIHAGFLPVLDRTRPSFSDEDYPQPISAEVNQLLTKELSQIG